MISRRRSVLFELAHYASQFRCRERRAPLYRHGRANAFQMRQKGPRASKSDGIILIKGCTVRIVARQRSEEHTSELQSLMRISYAVFCLKKKKKHTQQKT